jgi:hypothetical protein
VYVTEVGEGGGPHRLGVAREASAATGRYRAFLQRRGLDQAARVAALPPRERAARLAQLRRDSPGASFVGKVRRLP